jgi:hypothetical protein
MILFKYFKDPKVREPARKTAAESQSNACPDGRSGCTLVQG